MRHISDLTPDPQNARKHNPRNLSAIETALNEVGAARSIVIDENGVVLAGNGLVEAAAAAGITNLQVVEADGETIIAVRRSNLSEDQKRRLALFDNRAAELAEWDTDVLAAMIEDGTDMTGLWSAKEMANLLGQEEQGAAGLGDPNDVPELPAQPVTRKGDMWVMGDHRLLCGDSEDPATLARICPDPADMIFTDPPYGVQYVGKTEDAMTIANDTLEGDTLRQWLARIFGSAPLKPGGAFYVCSPAGDHETYFRLGLIDAGLPIRQELVWVKQQFVMGHSDYHWRHETILYGWKPGANRYFVDSRRFDTLINDEEVDLQALDRDELITLVQDYQRRETTTVIRENRPHASVSHPTMKPVNIPFRCLRNSSEPGDLVLDCFAGAGSTAMAAELLGRRSALVELDPAYCDVIVERWQQVTGGRATREVMS